MLHDLVMSLSGLVLMLGGIIVLLGSERAEVSTKSAAALMIATWGAWLIACALSSPDRGAWPDALGPAGAALWVLRSLHKRCGGHMRRRTDFGALDDG